MNVRLGKNGFKNPLAAEEDAMNHVYGIKFAVVEKAGDFGWIAPFEYVEKLVKEDTGIRILRTIP